MISLANLFFPLDNISLITFKYIDLLKVKVTRSGLSEAISVHPDSPSMLAISDVLESYGIESLAVRINEADFESLSFPFITLVEFENKESVFTIVRLISDHVEFLDPRINRWKSYPISDFLKIWSGTVLLGEAMSTAGERKYKENQHKERRRNLSLRISLYIIPLLVFISVIQSWIVHGNLALFPVAFTILSLAGAAVGLLLILYEIDMYNPVLKNVCSGNKQINCDSILQSKASTFFGVKLSVIGFSYFSGILVALLVSGIMDSGLLFFLSWLSIATLPFIGYSFYYQWRVVKQWCVLCLWVQGILAIQAILVIVSGNLIIKVTSFIVQDVVLLLTAFSLVFISAKTLLPALLKVKEGKRFRKELQKFKYDPQVFNSLLSKQKFVTANMNGLGIFLGNPHAQNRLVKVCNPYCGPCAKAHPAIDELLKNNPEIGVQVIFTATNDERDQKAAPVKHLLAIAEHESEDNLKQAMDDWYNAPVKDYEVFANKYKLDEGLEGQGYKLDKMRQWCDKMEINFTPTYFINGYQLPENYNLEDLKYLFKK